MNLDNTKILNKLKELSNGGELPPLLISASGGMDSMVMLDLFLKIKNQSKFNMFVSHINYQIQKKAFYAEKMVVEFCTQYKIPFKINRINLNINSNFEAKARNIRYKIFNNLVNKKKLKYICTAHHWDDQLETLYMKNVQNAPLTSFRGILEYNKNIWRPLLEYKKLDILKYAKENKLNWIEDSTNSEKKYFRNKVRIEEIPKLKREKKKLIEELFKKKKTADNLFKKTDKIKLEFLNSNNIIFNRNPFHYKIELNSLSKLKYNNRQILIQSILSNFKINLQSMTKLHWKTFWQFIKIGKTGKEFKLYNNINALIDRDYMIFYVPENIVVEKFEIKDNLKWYNSKFKLENVKTKMSYDKQCFLLDKTSLKKGIYVRNWKYGDTLIDNDLNKIKKVSDIFIKNKISRFHKMIYPIIVDSNDKPICVPNLRHNNCNNNKNNKYMILKWQQN